MFQIFPDMGNKHCSIIFKCSMYTCDLQHKKKKEVPLCQRMQDDRNKEKKTHKGVLLAELNV